MFDGVHDINDGDESLPYPDKFGDPVNELRAQAEAMVLSANGDGMMTCVLRACNVFGPGDAELVPLLVGGARSGWLKFIIGDGKNICDFTYVENVAHANMCAEQALSSEIPSVAGEAFFITNKEPIVLWEFISNILGGLGYQRPRFRLPFKLVLFSVLLVERAQKKLGFSGASTSHLTPAIVYTLSCTRTFDCSKARRNIGYLPDVSLQDGVTLTVESFAQLAKDSTLSRQREFSTPSKADKLLGSGTVADILLWRDDKKTFTCVLALYMLLYWFLLSGRTFVSSAAGLLLAVSCVLYFQGSLPSSVFGYSVEKLSSSHFEISESCVQYSFGTFASIWNSGVLKLKSLAKGDDWSAFFKAAAFLYLIRLLLLVRLPILIGVGLMCLFTLFIVYEQYEEQVERVLTITSAGVKKSKEKLIASLSGFTATYIQKN